MIYVILFNEKIDIFLFIRFPYFPINRILYLLFYEQYNSKQYRTPEKQKRKELVLKGIVVLFILKGFKRFITGSLSGLPLGVKHLDDLWFVTTQH